MWDLKHLFDNWFIILFLFLYNWFCIITQKRKIWTCKEMLNILWKRFDLRKRCFSKLLRNFLRQGFISLWRLIYDLRKFSVNFYIVPEKENFENNFELIQRIHRLWKCTQFESRSFLLILYLNSENIVRKEKTLIYILTNVFISKGLLISFFI